jgi:dolichol-phosphate mannosyltransferase
MSDAPEVSIVVPCHNEGAVAGRTLDTLIAVMERTGRPFEIVCVDDGSSDQTAAIIGKRETADSRIRLVRFSRNFGKEAALAAGLDASRGAAAITIDADLQHPPDLIPEMLARWKEGFEVVEAVKTDRGKESRAYRAAAGFFYSLMGGVLGRNVRGDSDYKLLDRSVVEVLRRLPERHRYYRGLVVWVGFNVAQLPMEIAARAAGETKWSLLGLCRYSLRNLVAFTSLPLRMIAWLGFLTVAGGLLFAVQTLWNWVTGKAIGGFTTTILLDILMSGVILVCLGVIAVYLAYVYEEIKGRPMYIVARPQDHTEATEGDAGAPDA